MASEGERLLKETYGWLSPEALNVFVDEYLVSDDPAVAWQAVRDDFRYDTWFPGNLTEDGRVRYNEEQYSAVIKSYDEIFTNVGLNPNVFKGRYKELIEGEVTPQELETYRVNPMYDRIISQSVELKTWYSDNYGVRMTDAALLGSALDPTLGERVLTKQISMAEIGGEALESGFDINKQFVSRMFDESADMTRETAERIFQSAESLVPALSILARRNADPDDDFDIEEFVAASTLGDVEQQKRIDRLVAQENSKFTGGMQTDFARSDNTGGVSGLESL